jgi:hypothetical protein
VFGHMKDPVDGTATLVSYVETNAANEFDRVVIAQVVVQADGLEPTAVEWTVGIPNSSLPPEAGHVWPVRVDRADPTHLKVDDDRQAQQLRDQS